MNRHERRAHEAQHRANLARANARLKTDMSDAYNRLDGVMDTLIAVSEQQGQHVPCTKGCVACCDQFLTVTLVEAEYIVARFRSIVEEVRGELLRQEDLSAELGVQVMGQAFEDHNGNFVTGSLESQKFLSRWFWRRIPCAFLDPTTKACRIYEARPIGCRVHTVRGHGPEVCDDRADPDGPLEAFATVRDAETLNPVAALGSGAGIKLANLESERRRGRTIMGPFPQLVLYALEGKGAP